MCPERVVRELLRTLDDLLLTRHARLSASHIQSPPDNGSRIFPCGFVCVCVCVARP